MDSHWGNLCENRMIRDANLTNYCQNHKQISRKSAYVRHKRLRKTSAILYNLTPRSHLNLTPHGLTPSNSPYRGRTSMYYPQSSGRTCMYYPHSRGRTSLYYPHSRGEDMFVLSPLEAEGKTWWPKGNHPPPWGGVRGGRTTHTKHFVYNYLRFLSISVVNSKRFTIFAPYI